MRRRYVSEPDIDTIIRLRTSGASWLKIEEATGVPRRTAKRLFEDRRRSEPGEELKAARQQVAGEALKLHMHDLVILAQSIVSQMSDPELEDKRSGNDILDYILRKEIHGSDLEVTNPLVRSLEADRVLRQNLLLLDSLKQHSREYVDWPVFDNWLAARNRWQTELSLAQEIISNPFDRRSKLENPLEEPEPNQLLIFSTMVNGVVEAVYRATIDCKTDRAKEIAEYIRIQQRGDNVAVLFGRDTYITELTLPNAKLVEQAVEICRSVVDNIFTEHLSVLRGMSEALNTMRDSRGYLLDRLDELRLTPLILRTRCELCPA